MQEVVDWECVVEHDAQIGELPTWSSEESALYWIDVRAPKLFRSDPETGQTRSWTMPSVIGSFVLVADGAHAIVALQTGVYKLEFSTGRLDCLHKAPYDTKHYRLNDGKCDRRGRFWVGSSRLPSSPLPYGGGIFYRLDDRGFSPQVTGVSIANGLAWSPDNGTMYIADAPNNRILQYDYDIDSGTASNGRTFVNIGGYEVPDGAAVDSEGGYWIAMIRGRRLLRFLPALYPSSDLKSLDSHAGSVFRCRPGVKGIAEPKFVFLERA